MSDIDVRRLAADLEGYYSGSYPPSVLDPRIASLTPATGSAAAGAILVTVRGTNFAADSVVEIDNVARPTTYVDAGTMTVSYDPTVAGTVQFTVRNSGGQESNSVPFVVGAVAELELEGEQSAPSAGNGGARRRRTARE